MGLNFADENEAANFQRAVEDKLNERRLRRERRMASKRQSQNGAQISAQVPPTPSMPPMPAAPQPVMQQVHVPAHVYYNRYVHSVEIMEFCSQKNFLDFFRPQDGKKKKKGKLRKEDISLPTNFQHISHVGWDPNRGFDLGMY